MHITKFLALIITLSAAINVVAQDKTSIRGKLMDTASDIPLKNGSIMILQARDSMLVDFTRAQADGDFNFDIRQPGEYLLIASYPKYADYVVPFSLNAPNSQKDFGTLGLTSLANLIEEVLITGTRAITIKGDTTEYNARSFTIEPNSKVEDLLRQLPGIQIGADGKITAQGKTVNKVLVDGEEFFGDDPTLVTRNLRGDMIDKVQLYEKRSDQAEFTGIDDGQRSQTLNLVLREDSKHGYFGKIEAGAGTDEMYQAQAMFNRFRDKMRFSAYGTLGNTGKTGLNMQDNSRFGGGGMEGGVIVMNGSVMISGMGSGDEFESFDGNYSGRGIPSVQSGAAHFNNKWDNDRHGLNANYRIGGMNLQGESNTITQQNLPSGTIHSTTDERFDNNILQHKVGGIYDFSIDKSANLKLTVNGTFRDSETQQNNQNQSRDELGNPLNDGFRNLKNNAQSQVLDLSLFWAKKLRKEGRTISWNLRETIDQAQSDGHLLSENNFYRNDVIDDTDRIDQMKLSNKNSSALRSNITYTEPLSDKLSVVFNYGLTWNNNLSNLQSLNASAPDRYDQLDSLFSNDFKLDELANQVGAIFNYKKDKHVFNFGSRVSHVMFNQIDRYTDNRFDRTFYNFNPQASWHYRVAQQANIRLGYDGGNTQPSIDQIQPVRVNDDPLNIVLGNPGLKPSFRNNLQASYSSFKMLAGRHMFVSASYGTTHNAIVANTNTDSVGRTTRIFENLANYTPTNYSIWASSNKTIKSWNMELGTSINVSGNTYYDMANGTLNKTTSNSFGGNLTLQRFVQGKYNISVSFGPNYMTNESSLQQRFSNNGWGMNGNYNFTVYLPAKIELSSLGRYTYNAATASFDEDFERFIVDASVSKKFLKQDALKLTASVNDLFRQNTGFSRSATNNMFTQNSYTTIDRFFLLTLSWDFNQMGGSISK